MASDYVPVKPRTIDVIVDEKMKVLEELCVVNKKNHSDIRAKLLEEVRKYPNIDPDNVVDRVAKSLIFNQFE